MKDRYRFISTSMRSTLCMEKIAVQMIGGSKKVARIVHFVNYCLCARRDDGSYKRAYNDASL